MNDTSTTAWLSIVLAHERDLRAFLSHCLPHRDDVSDVVQETYTRLLALSPERRSAVRSWRAFLFTTARNVAMDHLRWPASVSLDALPEIDGADVVPNGGEEQTPDEIVNLTQEQDLLARVIASLPEKCREVLTLRKIHGLSQKEIAQRLGIAEHTVEKHISYGVRLCAERVRGATGGAQSGADVSSQGRERAHGIR
ncbi:MAG TPA: sigma-70 family RNA polymerase sigma factor [Steroidobacteraceae bacterium]|nr:sigma-70 family RNA polymerase sigma factor [Steroidobacteraceae bacterium]